MSGWWQDLQFAGRMFRKRPGGTALAVIALALGIGLTTTMFSIVQGAILRGLPFPESDRILALTIRTPTNPEGGQSPSYHDFVDWRTQQQSFESLEGFNQTSLTVTGAGGFPERLRMARITPGTLRALRVTPVIGRDLTEADAVPGAPAVMLIGYRVWQSRFEAREDALGRVLIVNGTPTTVVGVMPPKFAFPQSQDGWLPLSFSLAAKRGSGGSLNVFGRLRDGVSEAKALTEMEGIAAQLASAHVENKDMRAFAQPYVRQFIGEEVVSTLFTMLGAVFGVMIIACVNVTNLQLARAAERTREIAVRLAIGSSRWRIVRQTLAEGLVLSSAGALTGLGLAYAGTSFFNRAIVDTQPPFWIDVRLDPVVLGFVTLITVTAALVSSLVPGWRLSRTDINGSLKDEGRGTTSIKMGRFTRWLVVVEVTLSCVLLVVSGLMVRSIINNSRFDMPFATEDVFFGQISLDERTFPKDPDVLRGNRLTEERLARAAGVRQLALATDYARGGGGTRVGIEGKAFATPDDHPRAQVITSSVAYFDVLRVQPVLGRPFNDGDSESSQLVAIVDEAFARRHLPEGALGRRIRFGSQTEQGLNFDTAPWLTVVGVVPTLVTNSPNNNVETIYRPLWQRPQRNVFIFASTPGDPMAVANSLREVMAGVGEGTPIVNANSLAGEIWRQGWAVRLFGGLFLVFGIAALFLAAVGLYGVMAFNVRQRTQEIGVRMALGAERRSVLGMILWQGVWRVAAAVAIGLVPGWQLGLLMRGLIRNVSATDPLVYIVTAVTMLASGVIASLVPALRAASVDPVVALRGD